MHSVNLFPIFLQVWKSCIYFLISVLNDCYIFEIMTFLWCQVFPIMLQYVEQCEHIVEERFLFTITVQEIVFEKCQ